MKFKMEHLHVKAQDPQKTADWWVKNLGAKIKSQQGGIFRLDLHGTNLVITSFMPGQKRMQKLGLEHIAITTDDLDSLVKNLKADGGRIVDEVTGAYFVETPEGVQLELSQG